MIDFENSSPKGELVFLFKIFPFNFGSMKSSRRSEESGLKDFSGPFSVVVLRHVLVENGAFLKLTIEPRSGPPWKRTCPIFY